MKYEHSFFYLNWTKACLNICKFSYLSQAAHRTISFLGRRWASNSHNLAAVDTELVALDDLLANATWMENTDIIDRAGKFDALSFAPNATQTDSAIEKLSRLVEHRAVGEFGQWSCHPVPLTCIACGASHKFKDYCHDKEVNCHNDHEAMHNQSKDIADSGNCASFNFHLLVRKSFIRVKSIYDQKEKESEGVHNHYKNNNKGCVLVFSPVFVGVSAMTPQWVPNVLGISKDHSRQID